MNMTHIGHDTNRMSNIFLFENIRRTFFSLAIKYHSTFNPYASGPGPKLPESHEFRMSQGQKVRSGVLQNL